MRPSPRLSGQFVDQHRAGLPGFGHGSSAGGSTKDAQRRSHAEAADSGRCRPAPRGLQGHRIEPASLEISIATGEFYAVIDSDELRILSNDREEAAVTIRPEPVKPLPGQDSVWDYLRPPRLETFVGSITVEPGGKTVASTKCSCWAATAERRNLLFRSDLGPPYGSVP